jgi:riboflavin kinase/FMN adenylyltransferase
MNIGTNPTVGGTKQSIEIYFFNFNQDLYNKRIKIELLDWLREERKFESLEHLQSQLKIDKVNALKVIEKKSPNLMD